MSALYPLRFAPVLQYRPWGGRSLGEWLHTQLPGPGPYGEAWLLSDRDDCQSLITEGPLAKRTLHDVMACYGASLMGKFARRFARFPLLLKFLDVHEMLSVQVHPSDHQAALLPAGEHGKDEAWVVLDAQPGGRIYAGLKPGVDGRALRALCKRNVDELLPSFAPTIGQGVMIEAGTVHSLGDGLVVFEIQENSDVTFRLYDWDRIDQHTHEARPLQVDQALAAIDYAQGVVAPVQPVEEQAAPMHRERLFDSAHFRLSRIEGEAPSSVGAADEPRVLVCTSGRASVERDGDAYGLERGDVVLLPAELGACVLRPHGAAQVLEIAIPA